MASAGFHPSDLVLRPDGAVYHLGLHPQNIAPTLLLVGDPHRVEMIGSFFDEIHFRNVTREFTTLTGSFNGCMLTALGTGIGTDNIDIVINELDALANIDLGLRKVKSGFRPLTMVRIGTCGSLQPDILPGDIILSEIAIGFDAVGAYYKRVLASSETGWLEMLRKSLPQAMPVPYVALADPTLLQRLAALGAHQGATATAGGFYGPQGRSLRLPLAFPELNPTLASLQYDGMRILNWEMETSALYALGGALGHACATVCLVVANRQNNTFLPDYKPFMNNLIRKVLQVLTSRG